MRFSKNVLILLTSYLGVLLLVTCAARFLAPLPTEEDGDAAASLTEERDAVTVSVEPMGTEDAERVEETEEPSEDVGTRDEGESVSLGYLVRVLADEDGRSVIAVYDGEGRLLHRLGVSLAMLPASDRAALAEGIRAADDAALAALIEDLGG